MVDTRSAAATLSGRGARVYIHAHVSMITYRVDVYRSRPIGASLLTTSPQQGCLALKGLHTGWLGVVTGISSASTGGVLVSLKHCKIVTMLI